MENTEKSIKQMEIVEFVGVCVFLVYFQGHSDPCNTVPTMHSLYFALLS